MAQESRQPPTLEIEGARLRPLREGDAGALYEYLRDPAVTELTSYPEVTTALVEALIAKSIRRWHEGDLSRWAVARGDDDRLIGTCGFNDSSPAHRWAEVAFELSRAHWGKGLMGRAATAAIGWAFEHDRVDRVQAYTRVDNFRSQRLLERLGFLREGRLRSFRICRGRPHDFYVYGLLRSDWIGARVAGERGDAVRHR
ncbi:MAG: GNAT family N-acetyltransferase [Planctomycetes bacterium]|nr:GNAT family N-acetyltransferase [Planctomycetota bacterium]